MRQQTLIRLSTIISLVVLGAAAPKLIAQPDSADQGEYFFTEKYKCFACHGYSAQTGLRRLVPMNYNQEGFIALLKNSPFPLMPSYNDVPESELAEIYDFIRSIPSDAPEIADIPVLRDIAEARREAAR